MLGDQGLDVGEGVGIEQHLAAVAVIKNRDRHAPGALARDAPVAPVAHHRLDPVAAALRHPGHGSDRREGLVAEAFHRSKPLLGGAEDRGLLGAPVVGVAVGVALLRQQGAGVAQGRQDGGVGVLEHVEPGEGAGFGGEGAALIHRAENRQAVLAAGIEVVDAVARGSVHQAGAGFGGHVVAAHQHRRGAIQQGMAVLDPLQRLALHAEQGFEGALQGGAQAVHERFGHHQIAGGVGGGGTIAADGVVELAIDGDGQVGGQGPGGGGPDRHEQLLAVVLVGGTLDAMGPQLAGQGGGQLHHRKGHVGAGGGVAVGVFQFGLGQGGAGARAPVHRLEAPVDVARQHHLAEHTDLGGLVGLVEGEVGLVPVGPDAPAAETAALALHLLEGVGVGAAAQAERGELLAFVAGEPLQHLQLDRQAVAVPARHEARPLAVEQGVLVDDVLEHLVKGVADMQGAVGVGRSVMQGEHRARTVWVEPFTAEPFIEPHVSPEGLDLGLPHPGVGPHLERRLQQVEGVLVGGRAGGHNGGMREGGIIPSRRTEPGAGVRRVPPVGPVGLALLGPWAPILGSPGSCSRGPGLWWSGFGFQLAGGRWRRGGVRGRGGQGGLRFGSRRGGGSERAGGHGLGIGAGGVLAAWGCCGVATDLARWGGGHSGVIGRGFSRGLRPHPAFALAFPPTPDWRPARQATGPRRQLPDPRGEVADPSASPLQQAGRGDAQLAEAGAPTLQGPQPLPFLLRELAPAAQAHLQAEAADQQSAAEHAEHRRSGEAVGTGDHVEPQQQQHGAPGRVPGPAELRGQQGQQQHGEA